MTDGENDSGLKAADFLALCARPPDVRGVRTLAVVFGDADRAALTQIATATGGAVFDATAAGVSLRMCSGRSVATSRRRDRGRGPGGQQPGGADEQGPLVGWLTSRRNAAGSLCGIAGVVLGVTGVVPGPWWPLAVGALYAAGALGLPRRATATTDEQPYDDRVDVARLRADVDTCREGLIGRVPTEVIKAVDRLALALGELFDRPDLLHRGSPETFVIQRLVDDYLPTALNAYVSLPRAFAGTHRLPDGRTPRQVLLDQLTLLEKVVRDATEDASRGEADRLLAHERFLADRFGPRALGPVCPVAPDASAGDDTIASPGRPG